MVFDPFHWVFSEEKERKERKRRKLWEIMYIFFALLCFSDKIVISITVTWEIHIQKVLSFSVHLPFLIFCYLLMFSADKFWLADNCMAFCSTNCSPFEFMKRPFYCIHGRLYVCTFS
jgi:hypothetical protein